MGVWRLQKQPTQHLRYFDSYSALDSCQVVIINIIWQLQFLNGFRSFHKQTRPPCTLIRIFLTFSLQLCSPGCTLSTMSIMSSLCRACDTSCAILLALCIAFLTFVPISRFSLAVLFLTPTRIQSVTRLTGKTKTTYRPVRCRPRSECSWFFGCKRFLRHSPCPCPCWRNWRILTSDALCAKTTDWCTGVTCLRPHLTVSSPLIYNIQGYSKNDEHWWLFFFITPSS